MQHYRPTLANGVPLRPEPPQYFAYKSNFQWPLRAGANIMAHMLKTIGLTISLACYVATIVSEFSYIAENINNIAAVAECLTTSFMGLQYFCRSVVLLTHQTQLRALLQHFYAEIYFTKEQPQYDVDAQYLRQRINRYTRFISIFTYLYYVPMMLIFVMFGLELYAKGMSSREKPYFYRSSFPWYDAQEPRMYIITSIYTGWLAYTCCTIWSVEDYLICIVLCHTSHRYKQLRFTLRNMFDAALQDQQRVGIHVHQAFRQRLNGVIQRQQLLYNFVLQAKAHFTYQIFFTMTYGVLLLCVVMFQLERTQVGINWVTYISWIISQTSQFIIIGFFGQMLLDESLNLSHSFYTCRWEALLPHGDVHTNALLMRDIQYAILNTTNPVVLDGMKLFALTHGAIGTALRSAMSYFMFLNTMSDTTKGHHK